MSSCILSTSLSCSSLCSFNLQDLQEDLCFHETHYHLQIRNSCCQVLRSECVRRMLPVTSTGCDGWSRGLAIAFHETVNTTPLSSKWPSSSLCGRWVGRGNRKGKRRKWCSVKGPQQTFPSALTPPHPKALPRDDTGLLILGKCEREELNGVRWVRCLHHTAWVWILVLLLSTDWP